MPGSRSAQRKKTGVLKLTMSEREIEREGARDKDHPTAAKKNKAVWRAQSASIKLDARRSDIVVW